MADEEEYVQLTIPEAFIYKVPPRTSAQGHKASDWKDQVAIVKVAVVTRGREIAIKLYRVEGEKLFAICPIRRGGPNAVEPVTDSSRYFCLRIEDGKGNHAFVGLGFNKREDAFDLKSSIADAEKQIDAEEKGSVDLGIDGLGSDFSLKQGQTFAIKIGAGASGGSKSSTGAGAGAAPKPLSGPGKLAPPGTMKLKAPGTSAPAANGGDDLLGLSSGVSSMSVGSKPAAATPAPAPSGGDWVAF